MSDPYETSRIRRGLSVLMDEAPVAPDFEGLTTTHARATHLQRPTAMAAIFSAVAVIGVFVIGGLLVAQPGGSQEPAAAPARDMTTVASTTSTTSAGSDTTLAQGDVVRVDAEAVASEFLQDIPLPDGSNSSAITTSISIAEIDQIMEGEQLPPDVTRTEIDRYFIGAHVASAAACAWIEVWLDARADDDQARVDEAVAALGTSREWSVLTEMDQTGDFPNVVWEYADAVAGDGTVPAGYPGAAVADTYRSALGCPSS